MALHIEDVNTEQVQSFILRVIYISGAARGLGGPSPPPRRQRKKRKKEIEGGSQNGGATCSAKIYDLAI